MGRTITDTHTEADYNALRLSPLAFLGNEEPHPHAERLEQEIRQEFEEKQEIEETDETEGSGKTESGNQDVTETDDDSQQGGGDSGGSGGVWFEETEHDFDSTELQGLSLPIFRRALKKGLKLASRITKHSDRYLRNFLPENLRTRVLEVTLSQRGHPTLLLDKGEIVQYQMEQGKLERVRVSPDLEAERAVKYAMAGFIAAGESIDPAHVKFGTSEAFKARMEPIWRREWDKIQQREADLRADLGIRLKDARFGQPVQARAAKPLRLREWKQAIQKVEEKPAPQEPHLDLPRATMINARRPQI